MTSMRIMLSRMAYRAGAWQRYHQLANRNHLTVVSFHHVVPAGTMEWHRANRTWTVSTRVFEECMCFFLDHYSIVSLPQLMAAVQGRVVLPDHPLLVTFDDGWENNERHALPLLEKYKIPAVVFAVAGWVGQNAPWNEVAMQAWQAGILNAELCSQWWIGSGGDPKSAPSDWDQPAGVQKLLVRLEEHGADERSRFLEMIPDASRFGDMRVATADQLAHLQSAGVAVGSHGLTHLPLALTTNPRHELRESRTQLATLLHGAPSDAPRAISFPHGSYDSSVVALAREEGYRVLFTSDSCLNRCREGRPADLLGRIPIVESEITGGNGKLRPERMAAWMFRRPARYLSQIPGEQESV